jgi:hypothetical protein
MLANIPRSTISRLIGQLISICEQNILESVLSRQQVTFLAALESGRLSLLPLNIIARNALSMRLGKLRHGTRHALSEALAVALAVVP